MQHKSKHHENHKTNNKLKTTNTHWTTQEHIFNICLTITWNYKNITETLQICWYTKNTRTKQQQIKRKTPTRQTRKQTHAHTTTRNQQTQTTTRTHFSSSSKQKLKKVQNRAQTQTKQKAQKTLKTIQTQFKHNKWKTKPTRTHFEVVFKIENSKCSNTKNKTRNTKTQNNNKI